MRQTPHLEGPRGGAWGTATVIACMGCASVTRGPGGGPATQDPATPTGIREARALLTEGRYREAEQTARAELSRHPQSAESQRLLCRALALQGEFDDAHKAARQLQSLLGPNDPTVWIELGHLYELEHRFPQALAEYDRAAERAPEQAAGPREGGLRAARWGELRWAQPRLEEALRREPRDPEAWHALGLVRLQLGDRSGARQAYQAGLRAEPNSFANHLGLATVAWMMNDAAQALLEYEAMAQLRPTLADVQLGRAWALIQLGRWNEAKGALARAERLGANPRVVARQRCRLRSLRLDAPTNASLKRKESVVSEACNRDLRGVLSAPAR